MDGGRERGFRFLVEVEVLRGLRTRERERATKKKKKETPQARSARVFPQFFRAANHCLAPLIFTRSLRQARVLDGLFARGQRAARREPAKVPRNGGIESEKRESEREPPGILFFRRPFIFFCNLPASCDACRTPSAANLLSGRCVCTKGVERASAGGEPEAEEKGGRKAAWFFAIATLGPSRPLLNNSIRTLPSPPLRRESPARARTGTRRWSLARPRGRARGEGPPFGRT